MEDFMNIPTIDFGPVEDKSLRILKVIGVGGGGCNAVRNMYGEGIDGVSFAVCNTDSKVLANSPVPVKLQLGEGLGAGANPEIGKSEAESNEDDIRRLLNDNTKMVFITAGMGGGTGTGAAPVVARVAKELGILTVAIVTIPFYFERKKKIIKALKGVDELRRWYRMTARLMDNEKIEESILHLTNPLDNAINEKCSRIKRAFMEVMDEYHAYYYIISGHSAFNAKGSSKMWYKRLKVILLPRNLVSMPR